MCVDVCHWLIALKVLMSYKVLSLLIVSHCNRPLDVIVLKF